MLKIKAGSPEEAASFEEELNRIKLQADQVVLRISKDASHRVEAERTARIQAEQRAKNEAAARIEAQHRLQQEIDQLKALQEEARLAVQADHNQMQQLQAQFTDVTEDTDETAAIMPFENHPVASPSAPTPKDHSTSALLAICARHIMETNIIQVNADDTIADVLDRMLSQDSFYAIVTGEDRTEGIVSRTDLTGPVCEYLKPFIAKWQRPGYDATYNIAIKWIMSRQVNTIDSDASCTAIMKKMRELNMPPLLVIEHEKPIGLVTPFNVFKIRALLKLQADKSANSDRQLIRNLPARISSYLSEINKSKNIPEHQEIK